MAYAHRTRVRPVRPVNGARLPICPKGGRSIEPCSPDLRCYGMAISNRVQPQEGTAKWRLGLTRKRQLPPVFTTFLTIFSGIFRESLREGAKWARIRARTALVQVRTGALKRSTRDARRATVLSCGECKTLPELLWADGRASVIFRAVTCSRRAFPWRRPIWSSERYETPIQTGTHSRVRGSALWAQDGRDGHR
jgi:hypothetical protein